MQTKTDFPNYNCLLHANSCYDYSWAHVFFGASVIMNHETGGEARCAAPFRRPTPATSTYIPTMRTTEV